MSGGVDSSACAVLLQRQGYHCDGAMLNLLPTDNDTKDAEAVAKRLGMGFTLVQQQAAFEKEVMDHFVSEYCHGRTPNPCVDCNRCLKFGALMDWALEHGYDYLATGHYARVTTDPETGRRVLLRGANRAKDQSYVLYQLTQHQLRHLLLPVGDFDKPTIRENAREAGLVNADKSDSQDICFIPDGDYTAFLRERGVVMEPGNFVDAQGNILGRHKGLPCYTTGQRKGLGVSVGHHVYVVKKNAEDNTILLGEEEDLYRSSLIASRVNWISGEIPTEPVPCQARTRYSHHEVEAVAEALPGDRMRVTFTQPVRAITAGQAVVLYQGDEVLGGGTIDEIE